jgi:hypothetical protein
MPITTDELKRNILYGISAGKRALIKMRDHRDYNSSQVKANRLIQKLIKEKLDSEIVIPELKDIEYFVISKELREGDIYLGITHMEHKRNFILLDKNGDIEKSEIREDFTTEDYEFLNWQRNLPSNEGLSDKEIMNKVKK